MKNNQKHNYMLFYMWIFSVAILFVISFLLDNFIVIFFTVIKNSLMTNIAMVFSHTFYIIFFLLLVIYLLKDYKQKRQLQYEREAILTSVLTSFVLAYIIKFFVSRPRPYDTEYVLGMIDYSFPSTHTAIVFSMLPFLSRINRKDRICLWLLAVLVPLSRLILLKHYPSDLFAGALLGYFTGLAIKHIFEDEKTKK